MLKLTFYLPYVVEGFIMLVVGYLLHKLTSKKSKLVYYLTNTAIFNLSTYQPSVIGTHTITIQNMGNGIAEDVEICHGDIPYINVTPNLNYEIKETPQGGKIIYFSELAPKSSIVISYLYLFQNDSLKYLPLYVKSKEGYGKSINTMISPKYPKGVNYIAGFLMFSGLSFIIILIIEVIRWLIRII